MARPPEITKEEIIAAGETLIQARRTVTGFALRTLLKGGNATRLKQIWEQHLEEGRTPEAPPVELPVEISDRLRTIKEEFGGKFDSLAADLHKLTVRAGEARVGELVRSLEEKRAMADREMADAGETVDELEAKLAEANASIARRGTELEALQSTNQTQAVELSAANEKLNAALQQVQRLTADLAAAQKDTLDSARLQGRVEELERQNAGLLDKLSVARPTSS